MSVSIIGKSNINGIDKEIAGKQQEMNHAKTKFTKAKQTYLSITNWLKNQSESHKQQLTSQFFQSFCSHPQYSTQYNQQQLHTFAQQSANQKWVEQYQKLQPQISNAFNAMQLMSNKIKSLNQQSLQLQKMKGDLLNNCDKENKYEYGQQFKKRKLNNGNTNNLKQENEILCTQLQTLKTKMKNVNEQNKQLMDRNKQLMDENEMCYGISNKINTLTFAEINELENKLLKGIEICKGA
eukprot:400939_1